MSILLQARSVTHSAGGGLLFRDLNLAISVGDRLGLVGHNGSGKTTLLRLLSGTEEPDGGDVMRKRGLRLGMVEQFLPTELGSGSALEAVARNAPDEELWTAQSLLSALGFAENEFQFSVRSLSGGQRNRLMFAARWFPSQTCCCSTSQPTTSIWRP